MRSSFIEPKPRAQPVLSRGRASMRLAQSRALVARVSSALWPGAGLSQAQSVAVRMASSSTWEGTGLSQDDFMQRDECLVVDEQDRLLGTANKYDCHRFEAAKGQPCGRLHRAFSVFLFSPDGRLLLQQRAASKVTFPGVWTNTCCSHPLAGQAPDEVDLPAAVASGQVPGIKAAAVRKLQHELGIPPEQVPASSFSFLTRLHYCAADTATHGPAAEWGEHEVDYVLFVRPQQPVSLQPNPDEVDATRYVTLPELQSMMADPGLSWSPWFRILATQPAFLPAWWGDLKRRWRPGGSRLSDWGTIHRVM
uniref:isopentenyl-diphosphate Delta-isomerase n=1 Tax=Chlamydomonas reinhardtii TaxID=3055 RepID=O81691_CHLRE|nr:isopentenyl pyrophosphate:dimethylallyl pyrophosphate isomerase [Chlamydomonas reinhardtii]